MYTYLCSFIYLFIYNRVYFSCKVFDLRKTNIDHFLDSISSIDWSLFYALDLDVNSKCTIFHETFQECLSNCIPVREVIVNDRDPPWLTPILKSLINESLIMTDGLLTYS